MRAVRHWLIAKGQKFVERLAEPTVAPIIEELRRANLPQRDKAATNPLTALGCRYFSQNDEDGILLEILRRIGITQPSGFLEFGVGDGTENNTIILLALGWRGVWVGAENLAFDPSHRDSRLIFLKSWTTKDNAATMAKNGLASLELAPRDVRVASVDLDGNDGPIVRSLLSTGIYPDVFIVEYNAKFPPPIEFELPYREDYVWHGGDYTGVSLQRWSRIFSEAGYSLVGCNENGVNAFFVKNIHMSKFTDVPSDIQKLYRRGYFHRFPSTGYPTSAQTVRYLSIVKL